MSKKIWRAHERGGKGMAIGIHVAWADEKPHNCTVVPDSACFPVREAMRLCRLICSTPTTLTVKTHDAMCKYESAVRRMKAKKGSK
jgi:hypothetical protein